VYALLPPSDNSIAVNNNNNNNNNRFTNNNTIVITICEFPSFPTPSPPPHNPVQNKHIKILHRCTFLYLCAGQRVLKTYWDSHRLDWTRLGRCAHSPWFYRFWLDSTRLCRWVRTRRESAGFLCYVAKPEVTQTFDVFPSSILGDSAADGCGVSKSSLLYWISLSSSSSSLSSPSTLLYSKI